MVQGRLRHPASRGICTSLYGRCTDNGPKDGIFLITTGSSILNTIHNLYYYQKLMRELREAIQAQRLSAFVDEFYSLRQVD